MFAADLDGTLLGRKSKVSERTVETINKLKKAGIFIVIASGRSKEEIMSLVSDFQLDMYDKAYLLPYNGALTIKADNMDIIKRTTLSNNDLSCIIGAIHDAGMFCHLYPETGLMVSDGLTEAQILGKEAMDGFTTISKNLENIPAWAYKILVFDSKEKLDILRNGLPSEIKEKYGVFKSAPFLLEFSNKIATKGSAMKDLADSLGIDQDQIIAFGDEENDISLLNEAGLGVAMANATDIVKKQADLIAPSNEEDGVSRILEAILEGKEEI